MTIGGADGADGSFFSFRLGVDYAWCQGSCGFEMFSTFCSEFKSIEGVQYNLFIFILLSPKDHFIYLLSTNCVGKEESTGILAPQNNASLHTRKYFPPKIMMTYPS